MQTAQSRFEVQQSPHFSACVVPLVSDAGTGEVGLERADSFLQNSEAIEAALSRGVPLHEIEAYLDWLDATRT